jgi:predicted ferric reductase
LQVYIDGPFGAPTSQIFRAQHAVLIGTGIGVTPFASILQSIMHRYWMARNTCPKCKYQWTNDLTTTSVLNLRKVDFFWINRDQVRKTNKLLYAALVFYISLYFSVLLSGS